MACCNTAVYLPLRPSRRKVILAAYGMLNEQNFVIVRAHVSQPQLEAVSSPNPANVDCPDCKGSGQVDQHGGLSPEFMLAMHRSWLD
jgi:hypothetical protein